MATNVSILQANIFTVLGNFLTSVLPVGVPILQGQINRVAEPAAADYVKMWILFRNRLATNLDTLTDRWFTGSISGQTMTITAVGSGALAVNSPIFGAGVANGTIVTAFGTGVGGIGTYTVSLSQTVGSETLAAGTIGALQPTEITVQLDVHGPNSGDNAQIISTLFRDEFGVESFDSSGFNIEPLYSEDPRQLPFQNAEQQWEQRWTIDVVMQANPIVTFGQEFSAAPAVPTLIDVLTTYGV